MLGIFVCSLYERQGIAADPLVFASYLTPPQTESPFLSTDCKLRLMPMLLHAADVRCPHTAFLRTEPISQSTSPSHALATR